jgi:uncharacterized integral membrane protein
MDPITASYLVGAILMALFLIYVMRENNPDVLVLCSMFWPFTLGVVFSLIVGLILFEVYARWNQV